MLLAGNLLGTPRAICASHVPAICHYAMMPITLAPGLIPLGGLTGMLLVLWG